jgi:PmbA protein
MYFRAFYGEAAQKGSSRLKGKLNETIAVDSLTLLDDPHLPGGGASRIVDDEGVPTEPLKLIDSGRFSQFLYHVEPASKDGVSSTGHAARNYDSGISTTTHNLVVKTGEKNLQDLCSIPEECLLVTQLEGAAGCNPISGDISIGVQGFHYKNGRRVQPVDSITIAGNFFDLLLNIREYGNQYQPNLSSRFIPALLVEGFSISG